MRLPRDLSGYPPGKAYALALLDGAFRMTAMVCLLGHGIFGAVAMRVVVGRDEDNTDAYRWGKGFTSPFSILCGAVALVGEACLIYSTSSWPDSGPDDLQARLGEITLIWCLGSMPVIVLASVLVMLYMGAEAARRWVVLRAGRNPDQGRPLVP